MRFCSVQEAVAVEAFREGFLRCVGAVFMMGNDKVQASAKVTRGGKQKLYRMTEKELKKKLAPESLGNNPHLLTDVPTEPTVAQDANASEITVST